VWNAVNRKQLVIPARLVNPSGGLEMARSSVELIHYHRQSGIYCDTAGTLLEDSVTATKVSHGKLLLSQASIPPSSGRTLVIPFFCKSSATRALVASLGHEQ
jgi:hypothetical protein